MVRGAPNRFVIGMKVAPPRRDHDGRRCSKRPSASDAQEFGETLDHQLLRRCDRAIKGTEAVDRTLREPEHAQGNGPLPKSRIATLKGRMETSASSHLCMPSAARRLARRYDEDVRRPVS
jgi:hypothetical protein